MSNIAGKPKEDLFPHLGVKLKLKFNTLSFLSKLFLFKYFPRWKIDSTFHILIWGKFLTLYASFSFAPSLSHWFFIFNIFWTWSPALSQWASPLWELTSFCWMNAVGLEFVSLHLVFLLVQSIFLTPVRKKKIFAKTKPHYFSAQTPNSLHWLAWLSAWLLLTSPVSVPAVPS